MTRHLFQYVAASGVVLLAACAENAASVADLEAEIGTRLAQGPDAAISDATRQEVNLTAGFAEALRTAVLANDGYLAAQAFEQEALANVDVAESVRRPQLSANSILGATREGSPVDETTAGVSADVSLTQVLYDGGAAESAVNRATATALAARAGRMERSNLIALEAARAWIDLWQASERLALLRSRTGDLRELMDQMDRMSSNGLIDRASVEGAKQQVLDIQLEQTGLENNLSGARVRFAQFFQTEQSSIGAPDLIVNDQLVRARANDWQTAPALQRAAAELIAAERAQDEARAAFRPTVSVQAGVTSPLDEDETTDINSGFLFQYVVTDGGRRDAALEAATNRVAALEAGLTSAQLAARTERDAALAQLTALERSMSLVIQKMRLSSSEAKTARSQIRTGQANLRQLISAEIESYRASDRKMQLQAEIYLLQLTIASRSGYLTRVIGLEP